MRVGSTIDWASSSNIPHIPHIGCAVPTTKSGPESHPSKDRPGLTLDDVSTSPEMLDRDLLIFFLKPQGSKLIEDESKENDVRAACKEKDHSSRELGEQNEAPDRQYYTR